MPASTTAVLCGVAALIVGSLLLAYRQPLTRARQSARKGSYINGRQPSVWATTMVAIGFMVIGAFVALAVAFGLLHPHYGP